MGDHDDDNPATMMLPQVQDPLGEPATERIPATFADQSTGQGHPPSHAPLVSSVKTSPMQMSNLASTMALPEQGPRPGATLALPPEALLPPAASREGRAGTLIIDSAKALADAGITPPPPPGPPAPQSAPPPAPRPPFDSIAAHETPPPALESLQQPAGPAGGVQPAVPIGRAAPPTASPPNVITPVVEGAAQAPKSSVGGVLLVLLGASLVGGAAAALLVTGIIPSPWFATAPSGEAAATAEATATATATESEPAPPVTSDPPARESASAETSAPAPESATASASASSATASASASPPPSGPLPVPSIAVSVLAGDAYLLSYQGYLTVRSNTKADVAVQGVVAGKTNFKMMVRCGQRNVRLRQSDGTWLTEGAPILITCMQHTMTTIDL